MRVDCYLNYSQYGQSAGALGTPPTSVTSRLVALVLTLLLPGAAQSSAASDLLLRNVTPIDAVNGARARQDVLIRDGRIVALGQLAATTPDTRVIDARGRFLIPGLWDMHVHLSYDARLSDTMGDLFLDYGVTSVRDTGGQLETLLPIVNALRQRGANAPRVFFAGPLLDGQPVVYNGQAVPSLGVANTAPATAEETVRALRDAGASFIKIYEMVTPEVFYALANAAAAQDLPIAAHVPLAMHARDAGPRVQSMEHLRNVELDCSGDGDALLAQRLDALKNADGKTGLALRSAIHKRQRDRAIAREDPARCDAVIAALRATIQVPTARLTAMTQYPPFADAGWPAALAMLPAAVRDEWQLASEQMDPDSYRASGAWALQMIARLAAAGVPIGAGTDTPIGWAIPGFSLHRELEMLVHAGLTTRAALAAATQVPAQFFGIQGRSGQVAPGFDAELLLLDANPLESIAHTRKIAMVIVAGEIVRDRRTSP